MIAENGNLNILVENLRGFIRFLSAFYPLFIRFMAINNRY